MSTAQPGGAVAALIASHDWKATPLGAMEQWPQSLQIVLRILLGSRYAMWLGWGPDLRFFYNDAYARMTLGRKHPWALGKPAREVWPEIWSDIGPRAESVMESGVATWDEGLQLFLERSGFREETYHTFSYSPVPDDAEGVAGMLCVVTEDTDRIIGERRLRTLRELATELAATTTEPEVVAAVERALGANPFDLPFALTYLFDDTHAQLAAATGVTRGAAVAPRSIALGDSARWPVEAMARGETVVVDDLATRFASLPHGAWDIPPARAALVPIAHGQSRIAGFLVAGLNPYRSIDASYRGFVELVAGQIAAGIANSRAYAEERRRAEALAELDRAKTAFFSNVSHEFRTPLTLMLGPVEDLMTRPDRDPAEHDQLALVLRNGHRLLKLVNNLLDFTRIEAGRVQARYEPVDLARLTADVASVFRSAIERAGMRLVIDCAPLAEPVYVDREMWEKVLLNLLSNAFKYTLEGEIAVSLVARGERVELAVRDTGSGIPAAELPKIWSRFHRVEGAHGRTHEGTGIGLALVHEVVKLHGGTVDVASELGRGSTFVVTIPRGKEHLAPDRVGERGAPAGPKVASSYVEEALRWLPRDEAAPLTALDDVPSAPIDGERARILLADDNADMREYMQRLLSDRFDVVAVGDGRRALAAATENPPDLVLTDVMMPDLDGFGLLRALRAERRTATIPVIMLSARAGEEARVDGLAAGADDYLIKPFSARELIARVTGTLALSRFRRDALRREEELRAETANVLESLTEGFLSFDRDFRYTYLNAEAERMHGVPRSTLVGRCLWEAFPGLLGTDLERDYRRAMTSRVAVKFEFWYEPWNKWYGIDAYPSKDGGLAVYFRDSTDRKRRTEQLQQVAAAAIAVHGVRGLDDILQVVVDRAREIIGAREGVVVARHDGVTPRVLVARSAFDVETRRSPTLGAELVESDGEDRLATPILARDGQRIGALRLANKLGAAAFTAADHAILAQIAQTAAVALANAQLVSSAEEARAEAEAANRMKDQFLATLSHELRTPLNAILGWARILRTVPNQSKPLAEGLEVIERNSKVQAQLIEDLLDLSRIVSGTLRLDVQSVHLAEVIEAAIDAVQHAAAAKEIRIRSVLDSYASPVNGDAARLQQVVWNLLSNAVKFTPRGGQIHVLLERVNSHLEISVADTGIGIKPDFLPHVFERFRQADASTTRKHGGLGLGLSIVRQLVEMHGGTVRAKSAGEGQGATFSIALPVALTRADGRRSAGHSHEARLAGASLEGLRILVVDDEPDARDLVRRILSDAHADVETVSSVDEALTAIRNARPDVLLSDIGMPERDGLDLVREIRRDGLDGRRMPAVALTAFARPDDRKRALVAGFQMHVPKPVDPDELVAVVATLVGRTGVSS